MTTETPEELPSAKDINPFGCLDGIVAQKNWLGLNTRQGAELLQQNALRYQEDLMFMGPVAFNFYAESILLYLESQASASDDVAVHCLLGTIECRLKEITPARLCVFARIINTIEGNWKKYYNDDSLCSAEDQEKTNKLKLLLKI